MQSLKLGGLGANIGGEDWERARKKQEFFNEYGKQIRMQNMNRTHRREAQPQTVKEMSKREKAWEFAERVPRPRPKREMGPPVKGETRGEDGEEEVRVMEEDEEEEMRRNLEERHERYAEEMEKIKEMF